MRAHVFTADSAQADISGKLHALGLGWKIASTFSTTFAVVAMIYVPWNDANRRFTATVDLLDGNGKPVMQTTPDLKVWPIHVEHVFEPGRPSGLKPGSEITVIFPITFTNVRLPSDATYEFRLAVDGQTQDDWRATFVTRPEALPA